MYLIPLPALLSSLGFVQRTNWSSFYSAGRMLQSFMRITRAFKLPSS
jgi:hypothetical protein